MIASARSNRSFRRRLSRRESYAPKGKLPAGVCLIIIGTEGIPYSFAGGSDGYSPVGSLLAGPNHAVYGRLPLAVADQVVLVGAERCLNNTVTLAYQPAILCEGLKWLAIPWHSLLP
jgi:hypothetical protein